MSASEGATGEPAEVLDLIDEGWLVGLSAAGRGRSADEVADVEDRLEVELISPVFEIESVPLGFIACGSGPLVRLPVETLEVGKNTIAWTGHDSSPSGGV
jgi:hypothetical protein